MNKVYEYIEDTLNITNLIKPDVSLSRSLLIFYLLIANNYTSNLYSRQLKDFINNNRYIQHIIGFTTLLVIINLFAGLNNSMDSIKYSMILYSWFIFSTKLDLQWNLMIIGLLVLGYINENSMIDKEENIEKDEYVTKDVIKRIRKHNKKTRTIICLSIILVTIFGTYQYFNKKHQQYGGGFDPLNYMFCKSKRDICCAHCNR